MLRTPELNAELQVSCRVEGKNHLPVKEIFFTHVRIISERLHKETNALDLFIAFILLVLNLITFRLNKCFPGVIGQQKAQERGEFPLTPHKTGIVKKQNKRVNLTEEMQIMISLLLTLQAACGREERCSV